MSSDAFFFEVSSEKHEPQRRALSRAKTSLFGLPRYVCEIKLFAFEDGLFSLVVLKKPESATRAAPRMRLEKET